MFRVLYSTSMTSRKCIIAASFNLLVVQCCSVLFSVVQCCSVLCSVVQCCSALFSVVQCCSVLFSVVQRCSVLFSVVQCCSVLFSVVQCCSVLFSVGRDDRVVTRNIITFLIIETLPLTHYFLYTWIIVTMLRHI